MTQDMRPLTTDGQLINPTGNYVLVCPEDPQERTKGGLYLPDQSKPRPFMGTVLAVGPGGYSAMGIKVPMTARVGQRVLFIHRSGSHLIDKAMFGDNILMPETDIVSYLEEPDTRDMPERGHVDDRPHESE